VTDQPARLEKAVWSDADFDTMGWHDATIYAIAVLPSGEFLSRLVFDLDYIVAWVEPGFRRRTFRFWVAPATLVFDQAWELRGELQVLDHDQALELLHLHREPVEDRHGGYRWRLEGDGFDLSFRAPGYRQTFRRSPLLTDDQRLTLEQRGGVAFDEVPFT
jgi:hypothetical protein